MKLTLASSLLLVAVIALPVRAEQVEDSTFVPKVAKPAFIDRHPVVMIDRAHNNYFTMDLHYRAFASLLSQDGLRVIPGVQRFSAPLLKNCEVLVEADALGSKDFNFRSARAPAFLPSECDVVQDWVKQGGSLLLIVDHAPFAVAMQDLVSRFGVDMSIGYTLDTRRMDPEIGNPGCLLFSRDKALLGDHPITRGRNKSERINRVATFSGQSLQGPPGSTGFLVLSPSAADLLVGTEPRRPIDPATQRKSQMDEDLKARGALPAVGRFQGVAFTHGKGRVVVLGEGAMFGTQKVIGKDAHGMGKDYLLMGLNRPDLDNAQLALNIVHWLTRVLN
jgi:hypothetical protein